MAEQTPVQLTLGLSRSAYTEALFNGSVQAKGVSLTCRSEFVDSLDNTGMRHREILAGRLDGGECSTSSMFLAVTRGVSLVAIPVFPARSFNYRQVYCNKDAGIDSPADFSGKRVTVHRWNSTSPTWTKGLLQNEYGVDLHSINWFTAEPDPPGEGAPADFHIQRVPEPASREKAVEMLELGELDGGLDPYLRPTEHVRRVFPDWQSEAKGFFQRRGIYPMSHTVVLQRGVVEDHPWVAESLLEAFRAARKEADKYLDDDAKDYERWLWSVLDRDPHERRLGPVEQKTLNELVRYQFQQGLRSEPLDPIPLFVLDGN